MKHRSVNKQEISETMRFDGSFHNADGNIYHRAVSKHSSHNLSDYCIRIFTSGRNRRVYTDEAHGYPFLSNSDVSAANPFMSCKYSSRKYGFDLDAVLQPGMILTGRVGAIGQTAFVPPHWIKKNAMGSDNIIRIVTKPQVKKGYIYAFLASKMGRLILLKHSTGGVQPFITDAMVGTIPVPDFPDEFQKEIDGMIQESARLREEAADALAEAVEYFDKELIVNGEKNISSTVSIKSILCSQNHRFEGSYYGADGAEYEKLIRANYDNQPLSDFFYDISRPDIFKRKYVSGSAGLIFLGSSELFMATPQSAKFVSKKTPNLEQLILQEGWVLLPRSGTIGDVAYATSQHAQKLASEHVIRLKPDNILRGAYAYAFLSSKAGKAILQRPIFGSVIQHIEPPMLKIIPVPIFENKFEEIANLVISANKKLGDAGKLELDAIAMVEAEIEKWSMS